MTNQNKLNPDALDMCAYDEALLAFKKTTNLYPGQAVALKDAVMAYTEHLTVAQPVVSTVEELDALPLGTTVLGADRISYQMLGQSSITGAEWWASGSEHRGIEVELPARVLHIPEVDDA